jgi:hypothetical protein
MKITRMNSDGLYVYVNKKWTLCPNSYYSTQLEQILQTVHDEALESDPAIIKHIPYCIRCGKEHLNVEFFKFTVPQDNFKHYATCPITGEPILAAGIG